MSDNYIMETAKMNGCLDKQLNPLSNKEKGRQVLSGLAIPKMRISPSFLLSVQQVAQKFNGKLDKVSKDKSNGKCVQGSSENENVGHSSGVEHAPEDVTVDPPPEGESSKNVEDGDQADSSSQEQAAGAKGKEYHCIDCNITFGDPEEYQEHVKTHENDLCHQCLICGKSYWRRSDLIEHQETHSDLLQGTQSDDSTDGKIDKSLLDKVTDGHHICFECGKEFRKKSQLDEHLKCHLPQLDEEKKYTCSECCEDFNTSLDLNSHVQLSHPQENQDRYTCSECRTTFLCKSDLEEHMRSHSPLIQEKRHICLACGASFSSSYDLDEHLKTHIEKFPCPECKKDFESKAALEEHAKLHSESGQPKQFVCSECGRKFNRKFNLDDHFRQHTGEKPFVCPLESCGKAFHTSSSLNKHRKTHSHLRPYVCTICDKAFQRHSYLNVHLRMHLNDRPYKCEHCDKTFTQSSSLKEHVMLHTGDKNYSCNICDKTFSRSSYLDIHMRSHTNDKPHTCTYCDKKFSRSSHLKAHLMTHTGERPHLCPICGLMFTQEASLLGHIRSHNNERPHVCSVCQKTFTSKCNLNNHMLTHQKEKPYSCAICLRTFRQKSNMTTHMRTMHQEELQSLPELNSSLPLETVVAATATAAPVLPAEDQVPTQQSVTLSEEYNPLQYTQIFQPEASYNNFELTSNPSDLLQPFPVPVSYPNSGVVGVGVEGLGMGVEGVGVEGVEVALNPVDPAAMCDVTVPGPLHTTPYLPQVNTVAFQPQGYVTAINLETPLGEEHTQLVYNQYPF